MREPPSQLDGADVLCWAVSGAGGFYHLLGSDPPITVTAMAVTRYADASQVYLFKCDKDWHVVQDWDCQSIEEARALASAHASDPLDWQARS